MADAQTQDVVVNSNPLIDFAKMVFRFKKDKLGNKRANVEFEQVPVPSVEGLVEIFKAGGKQLELLQEVVKDTVRGVLADYVSDENFDPKTFDFSKVYWEAIANMPKEDRRSSQIATELWEGFGADYIAVMQALTGKTLEQVTLAVDIYSRKMLPLKTNKKLLKKMKEQIDIYTGNAANAETYQEILDLLNRRIENYLAIDEPAILEENL